MGSSRGRTMFGMRRAVVRAAFLGVACFAIAIAAVAADAPEQGASPRPLVGGVWISGQITPAQVEELKAQGIRTIIDLRPDGEAADQPSSSAIEAAAREAGLGFSHVSVADDQASAAAVDAVSRAILRPDNPVLIYARSGRPATRAWALAEASRIGGLDAEAIVAVANSASQPLDDLQERIIALVAARRTLP
jgi:uncharacterized protein (TIGR01244 family)